MHLLEYFLHVLLEPGATLVAVQQGEQGLKLGGGGRLESGADGVEGGQILEIFLMCFLRILRKVIDGRKIARKNIPHKPYLRSPWI